MATCNELPDLDHAHLSAPIKGQYIYNEELKFECDVGFVSSGDTTFKCQSNGTWITSSGNCSRKFPRDYFAASNYGGGSDSVILNFEGVSCGPPQITDGITVEGSSFLYGDTVTYTCPLNLQPKGSNVLTCKENGSWDAVPACEGIL